MSLNLSKESLLPIVNDVVKSCQLDLYELNLNFEFESDVIQVLIENKKTNTISFDELTKVNELLSSKFDTMAELNDKYILEVSSAGIERQIKTEDDLKNNPSSYVYVECLKNDQPLEFTGEFTKFENDKFNFKYFNKGQPKKLQLEWKDIKFIRHAINFKTIE
jgi:ribosome maturation factor RimP